MDPKPGDEIYFVQGGRRVYYRIVREVSDRDYTENVQEQTKPEKDQVVDLLFRKTIFLNGKRYELLENPFNRAERRGIRKLKKGRKKA